MISQREQLLNQQIQNLKCDVENIKQKQSKSHAQKSQKYTSQMRSDKKPKQRSNSKGKCTRLPFLFGPFLCRERKRALALVLPLHNLLPSRGFNAVFLPPPQSSSSGPE